jgi:hypothetical protein
MAPHKPQASLRVVRRSLGGFASSGYNIETARSIHGRIGADTTESNLSYQRWAQGSGSFGYFWSFQTWPDGLTIENTLRTRRGSKDAGRLGRLAHGTVSPSMCTVRCQCAWSAVLATCEMPPAPTLVNLMKAGMVRASCRCAPLVMPSPMHAHSEPIWSFMHALQSWPR